MPKCKTHKKVQEEFMNELRDMCEKHNISISSDSDIIVEVAPIYNTSTNLYESYGAIFVLNQNDLKHTKTLKEACLTDTANFPKHTR